ncbi:MAG: ABC transporter permease [Deltaproteobacteria bacterium]|nr:ABC transporter permease [Deltaproteobacteria bacterium]MBW1953059.1 ABC transporter permease [Deltaproteobacteria bacterium]MBW1986699.1 ABC transporter permease [Deltaproteobacteria bacterium]MBW2134545.1 ABC transporter permease [Deltaproteobacteria bacterium]
MVFKIIFRNILRHRLRTFLTITGMAVAILSFGLLRTVVGAWYAGVESSSAYRLVTRNAVSLIYRLPVAYLNKIRAVPGVSEVSYSSWFGGIYIDEKNFFPQFAVEARHYLDLYPEFIIPQDQKLAFLKERNAAIAGRQLAEKYDWQLGDIIPIRGRIYPVNLEFVLRGIYTGAEKSTDEGRFFFHWDYLNETLEKNAPALANHVGVFISRVDDPDQAAPVAGRIDALFKNSLAETLTETEKAFHLGFVAMTEAILMSIQVVSFLVIGVILVVLANTMAMTARERINEYATFKTLGFQPWHLVGLISGESIAIALVGGIIGLALSFPAAHVFRTALSQYFRIFNISSVTLIAGLLTSLGVGVVSAIIPAWQAARLSIAEGLRRLG